MTHALMMEIERGSKNSLIKRKIISYYMDTRSSTLPDLSRELELSVPTVTKLITEMIDEGFIVSYGKLETGEGRPPTLYGLNPDSGYFVVVDLKRFCLNVGLMNFLGDIVQSSMDIPYDFDNTTVALDKMCELVKDFITNLNIDSSKILSIGINISGRVNPSSGYSFSMFNFEERPLAEVLTERFDIPVCLYNDTRAMAYGEFVRGVVRGERNIVFINLSWGLGAGMIFNGELYDGKSSFAGEFGHFNVFNNEIMCHCGKKGCLETEASGRAFIRILEERVRAGKISVLSEQILSNSKQLTLSDIVDATNNEDLLCIEIMEEIGQTLGRYIAGLINLLNPELVIIGGVLANTGDYVLQPIKSAVRKYSLNMVNKDSAIVLSKLLDKAGMIGGGLLTRKKLFNNIE